MYSATVCGCLVVLICVVFTSALAQAQEDEAFVQYRQKVMMSNGANNGAIGDILKNKLPYPDHILVHAQEIQRMSALIPAAFKKEVTAGKTDAKPEIWKEWDKFVAAADAMGREAAQLATVAQGGNMEEIGAQVKKLGETCGSCHKPYRKPREESYKSRPKSVLPRGAACYRSPACGIRSAMAYARLHSMTVFSALLVWLAALPVWGAEPAAIQRGKVVLQAAGGCSCHTDEQRSGAFMAGGRPIKTPFGTVYSTNITPAPKTGIGTWSDADFLKAMTRGVGPHGQHYFPVFPIRPSRG